MRLIAVTTRSYGDLMRAVYETYGDRPFTVRDLAEKGIVLPGGYATLRLLRLRRVLVICRPGRPNIWGLSQAALSYLEAER